MAKNILKEAIADAKAVREVALANAKAALEEAFTPKLKSMLSAKLSEELDEDNYDDKNDMREDKEEIDELVSLGIDDDVDPDLSTSGIENDGLDYGEETDLDEEIDLDEILNELGLEGDLEEGYQQNAYAQADDVQNATYNASNIYEGCTDCDEDFDIDRLLEGINNLELKEFEALDSLNEVNPITGQPFGAGADQQNRKAQGFEYWQNHPDVLADRLNLAVEDVPQHLAFWAAELEAQGCEIDYEKGGQGIPDPSPRDPRARTFENTNLSKAHTRQLKAKDKFISNLKNELNEIKKSLSINRGELKEVNLLNSKLLYVNRLFKFNNLSESQKLRVVETLDKAESVKESKLIYETLKESFNIKSNSKRKNIKENLGMASKSSGSTQSEVRKEVIVESNNMVARMQKLANIQINQ